MLTGKVPFQDFNSNQMVGYLTLLNWRLPLPEKSKPLGKLIAQYWSKNPAERPAFAEITRKFRQGKFEFEPCGKIDGHNLSEDYCPPLNMPYTQEGQ
jgi:hypothetical protein